MLSHMTILSNMTVKYDKPMKYVKMRKLVSFNFKMAIIHLTFLPKIMISVSEMTVVNPFILASKYMVL